MLIVVHGGGSKITIFLLPLLSIEHVFDIDLSTLHIMYAYTYVCTYTCTTTFVRSNIVDV